MIETRFEDYVNDGEEKKELPFVPLKYRSDYVEMAPTWKTCRDAKEGGTKIKAGGEEYLPKLKTDQKDKSYEDYLKRAYWYGATGRSVDAFVGMIFRKSPTVVVDDESDSDKLGDQIIELRDHVTSDGQDLMTLLREITEEVLVVNRVGVLEDYPDLEGVPTMSALDEERLGIHSYTSVYKTEAIINWKVEDVDGRRLPVYFVLTETEETTKNNPFDPEVSTVLRVLYLQRESEGSPPIYKQAVLKESNSGKQSKDKKFYVDRVIVPLKNGSPLNRIPFYMITDKGLDYGKVKAPPIYDLVEVNLGHYRNSADYEREMHWISIKTAVFPGWDKEKHGKLEVGGALAGPPDQQPFILEATSTSPLKEEMTSKEQRMATLGAQLLAQKGRYVQSAETAQIQTRGETSTIASISRAVSDVFSDIMTFKAEWSGINSEIGIQLNTDFDVEKIAPENLKTYVELLISGKISFDTFYYLMSKMEAYPENWSKEKEIEAIKETSEILDSLSDEKFESLQAQILELSGGVQNTEGSEEPEEEE